MKLTIKIDLLWVAVVLCCAGLIILFFSIGKDANAQTPEPRPDIPLLQIGGIYPIKCMPTDPQGDLAQICFVRTDLPEIVELGCVPAQPNTEVALDLNVVATADQDAQIRCYAVDKSGLVSDYSENAGVVDFTRPGRPFVLSAP